MNDRQRETLRRLRTVVTGLLDAPGTESAFWADIVAFYRYVLTLDDDSLRLIRLHSTYWGGHGPMTYKEQHLEPPPHLTFLHERYARMVAKLDPRWYFAEPELKDCPFQYGALHDGRLINLDILRYQHAVANLVLTGVMAQVEQWSPGRRTVCEIGSGSGCFAFNLRRSLGDAALVLVDIPVSLFLTGAFLVVNDPEARLAIVDQDTPRGHLAELIASHDYILVPDSMAERLLEGRYDLFFNLYSFQEMPSATVRRYLEIARLTTRGAFYSENLRRHAKNPENTDSIDDLIHDHLDAFPDPAFYESQGMGDEVMRPIIGVGPLVGGSLSIRGELLLGYAGRVVTLRPPGS